jgi:hypothetical protein
MGQCAKGITCDSTICGHEEDVNKEFPFVDETNVATLTRWPLLVLHAEGSKTKHEP